jgi:hypothetical protein
MSVHDRLSSPIRMEAVSQQAVPTPHMHAICNSFLEEYEDRVRSSGRDQNTKTQLEVLCEALREEATGISNQKQVAFRQ